MIGGADSIRENAGVGGNRNPLNLSETALRIADFVNARTKTTSCDIVEKFDVDRKSASQYLRRLWLGGFIGKRARGLFEPAKSSPTPSEHFEDTGDSQHTDDFVDAVGSEGVEEFERVEDAHEPEDGTSDEIDEFDEINESDEADDSEDTVDTEEPEDTGLVDREAVSAGGFVDIADTHDSALTGDTEDSDDTEQSGDRDDAGDREDSEDASTPTELTSASLTVAARQDNPTVRTAGSCPDCGSELGKSTGKCHKCILGRARIHALQAVTAS